eukprot:s23_g59.t1
MVLEFSTKMWVNLLDTIEREKSKQDFKGVLRMLCESAGGGRDRNSLLSAKQQTLRMLPLTMMVDIADALSLPFMMSPMVSFSWPQFESLSFWMLAAPITFCIFAAVFMMPFQFGDSVEPKPEADVETLGESSEAVRLTTKKLHAASCNLRTVVQIHDNLRELDSNFNAFDFLSVAPQDGFNQAPVEPDTGSVLSPEPPADFDVENMGDPFEPRNPEDMALWMIGRLSERFKPAMLQGLSSKVQRCVAQREIMVNLCRSAKKILRRDAEFG